MEEEKKFEPQTEVEEEKKFEPKFEEVIDPDLKKISKDLFNPKIT